MDHNLHFFLIPIGLNHLEERRGERMGDMLAELEDVLRSKPTKDKITEKEELMLQTCKARAIGNFTVGALASSVVVYFASRTYGQSFTSRQRFNTSVGAAIGAGIWRFNRSLDSCVDQILELEGSRMQRELAQIILTKHNDNTSRMKLVKKYFYPEEVFSDSNPDTPHCRWRYRNAYFDNAIQRSEDVEDSTFQEKPNSPQTKQFTRSLGGGDMIVDPLDCIFGQEEASSEVPRSDNNTKSRRLLQAHKRAHRRHQRARHAEAKTSTASSED